jgi:nucleoside-triphosphatase THEP1
MGPRSSCIILTGPPGSGKTVSLRGALRDLAAAGFRLSAVIQPGHDRSPAGLAGRFSLELLSSCDFSLASELLALARELGPGEGQEREGAARESLILGRYIFDSRAFERAEIFLKSALKGALPGDAAPEILGIDEIGHLEMLRHEGLRPCLDGALKALSGSGGPRVLICAVREDCVGELVRLALSIGLDVETIRPPRAEAAVAAALRALEG